MMNNTSKSFHVLSICVLLVTVTLAVFWQVKNHEFINYDDTLYVTENYHVQAGLTLEGLKWAFTTSHAGYWHPLTWLSHMADCQVFGLRPGWHHLMNLFFHMANSLLLFLVLHRMTKALWRSAVVAVLFAVHPLHVESVAWVAERKDVLSTFFWMLMMGAYVYYVEHPGYRRYLLVLAFFVLGLLSKPMLVTLPFVLLLLDYWPLGRLQQIRAGAAGRVPTPMRKNPQRETRKIVKVEMSDISQTWKSFPWSTVRLLVWEKVPFFIFSVISSAITFYNSQREGVMSSLHALPFDARVTNTLISYVQYIIKMVWPQNLAVFYPHPGVLPLWHVFGALFVLSGITILVVWKTKRFPYLIVGWLWYMGSLLPVIGIVQVGAQAMADRYTYVPLVGLFIIIAWGASDLFKRWGNERIVLGALSGAVIVACIVTTYMQLQFWRNSVMLFRHAISVTTNNGTAHNNLGKALRERGNIIDARAHYTEALRINPDDEYAHTNLGNVLFVQGFVKEAIVHLHEALRIKPEFAEAHYNLGTIMASQGMVDAARNHFQEALRITPDHTEAHYNLGNILASQGLFDEAIAQYRAVIRINPNDEKAHNNMGNALLSKGEIEESIVHFREALRIRPDYKLAADNLKNALANYKQQQ